MNHPTPETWMTWLYGEATSEINAELKAHLQVCPECQRQWAAWRHATQTLNTWKLAPPRVNSAGASPWLKWAAAAALVLSLGFGLGRLSAWPARDLPRLQQALEPSLKASLAATLRDELRKDLNQELASTLRTNQNQWRQQARAVARQEVVQSQGDLMAATTAGLQNWLPQFLNAYDQKRTEEYQALLTAFHRLESQRSTDRKDLETLAVTTAGELRSTQSQLGQLAVYTRSGFFDSHPTRAQSGREEN